VPCPDNNFAPSISTYDSDDCTGEQKVDADPGLLQQMGMLATDGPDVTCVAAE